MSIQPDADFLTALRANLRHIDEGLTPDAIELKRLLLQHIMSIETAIANLNENSSVWGASQNPEKESSENSDLD